MNSSGVPGLRWTDVHCHVGDYPDPERVLSDAAAAGVAVYGSTVLPSEFRVWRDRGLVEVGLGFHPLHADVSTREHERAVWAECLPEARWLSEIGLDGVLAAGGGPTLPRQQQLLEGLLAPGIGDKILSVHARGAERRCADLVAEARPAAAAFHWYKGDLDTARRIVDAGMLFSINPMMLADVERVDFLRWVPATSLLWETDGPQLGADGRPTVSPADAPASVAALARIRGDDPAALAHAMQRNLDRIEAV
ncbi:MAG: hydrolase TatD [Microbacterium sp.]|jgi:TatD DNase family protein|nr:hydrolase TatD [Microbacterium sp.]